MDPRESATQATEWAPILPKVDTSLVAPGFFDAPICAALVPPSTGSTTAGAADVVLRRCSDSLPFICTQTNLVADSGAGNHDGRVSRVNLLPGAEGLPLRLPDMLPPLSSEPPGSALYSGCYSSQQGATAASLAARAGKAGVQKGWQQTTVTTMYNV